MISSALVGVKSSEDAPGILDLLRSVVATSVTVHVVSLVKVGTDDDERARLDQSQKFVDDLAGQLSQDGYTAKGYTEISAFSPGTDLARLAETLGAGLIVIGLQKRSRVGKALLGSDAQSLLMHSTVPVLSARIN